MTAPDTTRESLVVTTNRGEYFVIPREMLAQFRANPEQRQRIDEAAGAWAPGSYVRLKGNEASARPSYASSGRTTLLAWFQK